ncbi:MAG: homoserine O-acetyltransferase MetX [Polymorphobacter sp.]|uniref:homoserine O-acetyltransferase MetX n=1 Tax=Polymorphobacter sp. TaxID=1909290 RepID=UPI003A8B6E8E
MPASSPSAPVQDARFGLDRHLHLSEPLPLASGQSLAALDIGYETLGTLAPDARNAILICHALTGDQHVGAPNPRTGKPGWWDRLVGPGKPIDPARHFIICANVLGGCSGTSGPGSIDPATGQPYGMRFPVITVADMVAVQARLLDHLGIQQLHAVVGGSMGGMQALAWAVHHPERVRAVIAIATTARHSAQNIAFHEVGRQAIMADPRWRGGDYPPDDGPADGLAVARMAAHVTYLSEQGLTERFGRRLQDRDALGFGFDAEFQIESYLRHQGLRFTQRFDANSYLYITRAMDYFDLAQPHDGLLAPAFVPAARAGVRFALVSFTTDWLYPTAETKRIVRALHAAGAPTSFVEIDSPHGHDSFLLDAPEMNRIIAGFLAHNG